ncbi:TerD domain-containing protein [Neobacillus niacini]|uniref:TerD family protein n=1 Tax=Neobacillus niacini TaxID=86668 RepID=UPI0021CB3C89|nr:TerD domain-containing protein [Neobacillus niacini]MCM3767713.1 TerD domain-containing protein [Neobacillus niacini]
MLTQVQKGARVDITKNRSHVSKLIVEITWETTAPLDIDSSIFMIGSNGKCLNDDSIIFYGNSSSADGSIQHSTLTHPSKNSEQFQIDLINVSPVTDKLVLTLTIYDVDKNGQTFSHMKNAYVKVMDAESKQEILLYPLDQYSIENTLILAEIYRRNGDWKFSTNTGGFAGGLASLCHHFGLEIKDDSASNGQIVNTNQPLPPVEEKIIHKHPEPPLQAAIKLEKVTLKKPGDSISLHKAGKINNIHVKLSWTKGVDLDLHAFYITKQGAFGHIFFGNKGKLTNSPYIALDKDSGVGNTAGNNEENLIIKSLEDIDKIIFATNIFRILGFLKKEDNFAKYDGKVFIKTNNGDDIEVPLTSTTTGRWCIITKIDNTNPSDPKVININHVQASEPKINDL